MEVLAYHSYFGGIALGIALFRYNCIADLVRGPLPRGEQNRILQCLAHREWEAPGGVKVQVSVSALEAWLARYRQGGFEALKPRTRSDRGRPRAVDGTLLDRLAQLKAELPRCSVPQLIRLLEKDPSSGIAPGSLKRATVYRHLAAMGLTARTRKIRRAYHPFQRQAPGELWQLDETDGLLLPDPHRPGKWRKTVLFVVVDDHSRFSPHCNRTFTRLACACRAMLVKASRAMRKMCCRCSALSRWRSCPSTVTSIVTRVLMRRSRANWEITCSSSLGSLCGSERKSKM